MTFQVTLATLALIGIGLGLSTRELGQSRLPRELTDTGWELQHLPEPYSGYQQLLPDASTKLGLIFAVGKLNSNFTELKYISAPLIRSVTDDRQKSIPVSSDTSMGDLVSGILGHPEVQSAGAPGKVSVRITYEGIHQVSINPKALDDYLESVPVLDAWRASENYYLVHSELRASSVAVSITGEYEPQFGKVLSSLAASDDRIHWNSDSKTVSVAYRLPRVFAVSVDHLEHGENPFDNKAFKVKSAGPAGIVKFTTLLPVFTPPQWTDKRSLPPTLVPGKAMTYGEVYGAIENEIVNQGHFVNNWVYSYGDFGFAIVCRIEVIDDNGKPAGGLKGRERWQIQPRFFEHFDLNAICEWLRAATGKFSRRFRIIVLVVKPKGQVVEPGVSPGRTLGYFLQDSHHDDLPPEIARLGWRKPNLRGGHEASSALDSPPDCEALIYEFISDNAGAPRPEPNDHESTDAYSHLRRAGLWERELPQ